MDIIESSKNEQIKYISKLLKSSKFRREERAFVIEGPRMVSEAPSDLIQKVYVSESFFSEFQNSFDEKFDFQIVSDSVMKSISDTVNPKGILALVSFPEEKDFLSERNNHPLLFLETIQDPGNLGTIFRTAEAAGARGIVMSADTVDVFSPKVTRATMGGIFRMPFIIAGTEPKDGDEPEDDSTGSDLAEKKDFYEILRNFVEGRFLDSEAKEASTNIVLFGAALGATHHYDEIDYSSLENGFGFLIGNEGNGLSERALSLCTEKIIIPMEGKIESLNAAVSASLLMYEAKRQRDKASK